MTPPTVLKTADLSEGVNQLALPNLSMSQIKHLRPSNL